MCDTCAWLLESCEHVVVIAPEPRVCVCVCVCVNVCVRAFGVGLCALDEYGSLCGPMNLSVCVCVCVCVQYV